MSEKTFEYLEYVCANTPARQHYMLIQARDTEWGEIVWAIGDDHVCAVTRADFIRNRSVEYNDVLIREFPYRDNTPESVGEWKPLILELVKHTLDAYINHEGFVHVYPQWLPEDLETPMPRELLLDRSKIDHVILHDVGIIEAVPASEKAGPSDVL